MRIKKHLPRDEASSQRTSASLVPNPVFRRLRSQGVAVVQAIITDNRKAGIQAKTRNDPSLGDNPTGYYRRSGILWPGAYLLNNGCPHGYNAKAQTAPGGRQGDS